MFQCITARGLSIRLACDIFSISETCYRYAAKRNAENEATQPTLEVIRKLARALSVSADALVFEQDERGPSL